MTARTLGGRSALVRVALLVSAAASLAACASPQGAVESALRSDLDDLRRQIAAEQRAQRIDGDRAREIARAVLEREIASASDAEAALRIRALRPCARPLYDAFHDRAETPDDVGAEAALILLENGQLGGSPLRSYAESTDGSWRAVAARDTEGVKARTQRRAFFNDPDERVRRAALHAAVAAPDPRDVEALLDVSRTDPDPLARSLAIRALGRIGTERVVLALKDRWHRADEPIRFAIVDAWSAPASFRDGGKAELVRLVETEMGLWALQAAHALIVADGEASSLATSRLLRTARQGSTSERRMALRLLPASDPDTTATLKEAANDPDPEVAVLAQARLLDFPAERERALKSLRKLAAGHGMAALQARSALAAAGDSSVGASLLEQLADARASHRKMAALALFRLGRFNDAAIVLADRSPSVRSDVACNVLAR